MDFVPFKHRDTLLARVKKFLFHDKFEGICLASRVYPKKAPIYRISHVQTDDSITYDEAIKLPFREVNVGMAFGPLWSKHWFRLDVRIPELWEGEEVCLKWIANAECQVWVGDQPVQGLSAMKKRYYYTITKCTSRENLHHIIYVELSVNGVYTDFNEAPPDFTVTLTTAEITTFDRDLFDLMMDLQVLYELALGLPEGNTRSDQVLHVANDTINSCVLGEKLTYKVARSVASKILSQRNGDGIHEIHAVGYANTDTAWLWPFRKTPMKSVSSWSSAFRLMEKYPLKLAFTQPQQLVWVRERYPEFYRRVQHYINNKQFIPVGATWIEMDANLPSGESLLRQFLYGQKFYMKEFDIKCTDLWILDSFGYPAQLPQIMLHCDVTRFVSIKLSWNSVNTFPHNTFWWKGLGGHKVLTHFPPGNNYHKAVTVDELLEVERLFTDTGRSNTSLFLFGHGNAGLGPTAGMMEKLQRMENINGLPRVHLSTPEEFYQSVECDTSRLCTWVGELYLERHQGTYTSQAKVKKRNRRTEFLLHDMDLWTAIAAAQSFSSQKPYRNLGMEIERIWKLLLINQFHDILPGTAHPEVYKDFISHHEEIEAVAEQLCQNALDYILNVQKTYLSSSREYSTNNTEPETMRPNRNQKSHRHEMFGSQNGNLHQPDLLSSTVVANSVSWRRKEITVLLENQTEGCQRNFNGSTPQLALVEVPSCGLSLLQPCSVVYPVSVTPKDDLIHMSNHILSATIDRCGRLVDLQKMGSAKHYLSKDHSGNQFVMYDDFPLYRDAWDSLDFHLSTRQTVGDVTEPAAVIESGPLRAVVQVCLKISPISTIRQLIILDTECPFIRFQTQVSWHESHKFLKVEFPTSISSPEATYEIQFGHLKRPTHYNTSWEAAKYEVCCHRWAAISEHGLGLAVLNDCKYGCSCTGDIMRLSLLRSPTAPDPKCDKGDHEFTYALMPFTGTFQDAGVIQQAYNLNNPLRQHPISTSVLPHDGISYFWLDTNQVILETVKMAEDHDKALVVRLYEAFGGCTSAKLFTSLPVRDIVRCSGLEEALTDQQDSVTFFPGQPATIVTNLEPFQIISIMVHF